jgi:1-deoxy-D-xylulose-5-phosphate reductoisomerase
VNQPLVPLIGDSKDKAKPKGLPLGVSILGSTGSIGRQTLDVIDQHPEQFRVVALGAGAKIELLAKQVEKHHPDLVAVDSPSQACLDLFQRQRIVYGQEGLIAAATHPDVDIVVVATSGHAAMIPTARAIEARKTIALANKETIVCAGELIAKLCAQYEVHLRPVDSEHSAIWQSLGRSTCDDVHRLFLTASGGPFRQTPADELSNVTAAQALSHPTWSMGHKITIDSATLMNKGLELIEAHWLFGIPFDSIEILVHPESIVHSLVEFVDGSQIAQLGLPDMRLPIQYALSFPHRLANDCRRLSLTQVKELHFEEPDLERFPSLRLARDAGTAGSTYPTVLSAADEIAVSAFAQGAIPFPDIADAAKAALDAHAPEAELTWESIEFADQWARNYVRRRLGIAADS